METHFRTLTQARERLPDAYDAAEAGLPLHLERRGIRFALVTEALLLDVITGRLAVPVPEVYSENDGWTIVLPGTPVAADATLFGEALADFAAALREYIEDWITDADLRNSPRHQANAALVQLVSRMSEEQLIDWARQADTSGVAPASAH